MEANLQSEMVSGGWKDNTVGRDKCHLSESKWHKELEELDRTPQGQLEGMEMTQGSVP